MKVKLALIVLLVIAALLVSGCCCCCSWPSHRGYRMPYGYEVRSQCPAATTAPTVTIMPTPFPGK